MENQQPAGETQNSQKKPWYKKWWVIVLGIIFLYAIVSASMDSAKDSLDDAKNKATETQNKIDEAAKTTDESKTVTDTKPAETIVAPIKVTSIELSKAYEENEVAADEKYKGKMLEASGKITSIDNGIADNELIVRLSDGKYDMSTTSCYMNASEKEKVVALKKGQQVTLIGEGNSATLGSPVLKECTVK